MFLKSAVLDWYQYELKNEDKFVIKRELGIDAWGKALLAHWQLTQLKTIAKLNACTYTWLDTANCQKPQEFIHKILQYNKTADFNHQLKSLLNAFYWFKLYLQLDISFFRPQSTIVEFFAELKIKCNT